MSNSGAEFLIPTKAKIRRDALKVETIDFIREFEFSHRWVHIMRPWERWHDGYPSSWVICMPPLVNRECATAEDVVDALKRHYDT